MKILHLDSSARYGRSTSRTLSAEFVARLRKLDPSAEVDYHDLAVDAPPHLDELFTSAMYTPVEERTEEMRESLRASDALCERVLAADILVYALPMYNWSMPSAFKAYIDYIARPGVTFNNGPNGEILGNLGDKNVVFITTRGGDSSRGGKYEAWDGLTPALRAAFEFIGVREPVFIDVQPTQYGGEEAKVKSLEESRAALEKLAVEWTSAA